MDRQEILSTLKKWLTEEEISFKDAASPTDSWRLHVQDALLMTEIAQPANRPDLILIAAGLQVPTDMQARVAALKGPERTALVWDLRMALLQMGPDFSNVEAPFAKKMTITAPIYFDGFTKDNFMREWRRLRCTVILIIWTLNRKLGGTPEAFFWKEIR